MLPSEPLFFHSPRKKGTEQQEKAVEQLQLLAQLSLDTTEQSEQTMISTHDFKSQL